MALRPRRAKLLHASGFAVRRPCQAGEPCSRADIVGGAMASIHTTTVSANELPIHRIALPGTRALTVLVAFDAGARNERPEENGMAHFLEHLVFKGGEKYPQLQGRQRDRRAARRRAQRLHQPRSRRLPHHRARRERRRGDRPALGLRRAAEDRRRGARPRARRGDPGDQPRLRPAVDGRRVPDRQRGVRRAPARAHRAGARGEPAQLHARGDRRLPRAPLGGRARRRLPRRQPRPPARRGAAAGVLRALPRAARARPLRAGAPTSRRRRSSSSARPTSRTCA